MRTIFFAAAAENTDAGWVAARLGDESPILGKDVPLLVAVATSLFVGEVFAAGLRRQDKTILHLAFGNDVLFLLYALRSVLDIMRIRKADPFRAAGCPLPTIRDPPALLALKNVVGEWHEGAGINIGRSRATAVLVLVLIVTPTRAFILAVWRLARLFLHPQLLIQF